MMGFHSVGLRLSTNPPPPSCLKGSGVQVHVPELKAGEAGERSAAGDQVKNNTRIRSRSDLRHSCVSNGSERNDDISCNQNGEIVLGFFLSL